MKQPGKISKSILKLLYRSLDAKLSRKQQRRLDSALETSKELREEKEIILSSRKTLSTQSGGGFRPHFADRVMSQITGLDRTEDSFHSALVFAFKRLALIGAVVMIGLIFFNVIKGHVLPPDEAFYASDLVVEQILNLPFF